MTATRRLAAILAADVAGYSRLMRADEEGTLAALRAIRRELGDPKIAEHRGRIVKTTGDGLLVEFASVVDALRCAAEVQRAMGRGVADGQLAAHLGQRLAVRVGPDVTALVAQLGGSVPHRGQHEVGLLPVEAAAGEHRPGLDHQHRLVRVVEEVPPQLVAEDPASLRHEVKPARPHA